MGKRVTDEPRTQTSPDGNGRQRGRAKDDTRGRRAVAREIAWL